MTTPRDTQKARLYRAERTLPQFSEGEGFARLEQVQAYVDTITRSRWLRANFPSGPANVRVLDGRGRRNACAWFDEISMPRWSRRPLVILHELAHIYNPALDAPGHGRAFARTYLAFVERWLGAEVARALRAAFVANHVHWRRSPEEAANSS